MRDVSCRDIAVVGVECHEIKKENIGQVQRKPGPDLTGMGRHHPAEYFDTAARREVASAGKGFLQEGTQEWLSRRRSNGV